MMRTRSAVGAAALSLLAGVSLSACAGASFNSGPDGTAAGGQRALSTASGDLQSGTPPSDTTSGANTVGQIVSTPQPLIIRTGSVTLLVSKNQIVTIFNKVSSDTGDQNGYVESSSSTSANDAGGASLVLRVPSADFGTLVAEVDDLGKVQSQSENGQDVTGESIDLQARLENLKSEESALRALVAKAGSVTSILTVQNQLFSVEGDIEQLTAQENSLVDQATYSTLTVALTPTAVKVIPKPSTNAVTRSVRLAGHNTSLALRGIAFGLGWAFPAIVVGLLVLLVRVVLRRRTVVQRVPAPVEG